MPYWWPATLVVQVSDPGWQGTAIVPLVTSWKLRGNCWASLYSTKFALPWRWPVFWFTSAIIPAKAGDDAEVPPIPRNRVLGFVGSHEDPPPTASAWQIT